MSTRVSHPAASMCGPATPRNRTPGDRALNSRTTAAREQVPGGLVGDDADGQHQRTILRVLPATNSTRGTSSGQVSARARTDSRASASLRLDL